MDERKGATGTVQNLGFINLVVLFITADPAVDQVTAISFQQPRVFLRNPAQLDLGFIGVSTLFKMKMKSTSVLSPSALWSPWRSVVRFLECNIGAHEYLLLRALDFRETPVPSQGGLAVSHVGNLNNPVSPQSSWPVPIGPTVVE